MMRFLILAAVIVSLAGCCCKTNPADKAGNYQYIIDVRTSAERREFGIIERAIHIRHDEIESKIAQAVPDKTSSIAVFCRSGKRAGIAASKLKKLGYSNITNLGGLEDARKLPGICISREK